MTDEHPAPEVLIAAQPPVQGEGGGAHPTPALKKMVVERCSPLEARRYNAAWHSRLPQAQVGPWKAAYRMTYGTTVYAVALWHNPSARGLPQDWLELRRMAVSPDAPRNTPSRFLSVMARLIHHDFPRCTRMISYQDVTVHHGTIYKAAGWIAAYQSKARTRDRSNPRRPRTLLLFADGTPGLGGRMYRTNANGQSVDSSAKIRWEWLP